METAQLLKATESFLERLEHYLHAPFNWIIENKRSLIIILIKAAKLGLIGIVITGSFSVTLFFIWFYLNYSLEIFLLVFLIFCFLLRVF